MEFNREMLFFGMEDVGNNLNELTPIKEELAKISPSKWEEFVRKYIDGDISIKKLQEKIVSEGGKVDEYADIYNDKNNSFSRAIDKIKKFNKKEYKGMLDAYRAIRVSGELLPLTITWAKTNKPLTNQEKISVYLQAKDIQEAKEMKLPDRGEQVFEKELGVSHADYIEQFEQTVNAICLDNLHKSILNATSYSLDLQKQYGLISKEDRNEYSKRKFYMPEAGWQERDMFGRDTYYRKNENIGSSNPYNVAMIRAKGRKSLASDPIAYITSIAHSTVLSAEKNKTKQVALNFVMRNLRLGKESGMFGFNRVWYVETDEQFFVPVYEKVYSRPSQELIDAGKVCSRTPGAFAHACRPTKDRWERYRVVVHVYGEQYLLWFADERIANAINRNTERRGIALEAKTRSISHHLNKGAKKESIIEKKTILLVFVLAVVGVMVGFLLNDFFDEYTYRYFSNRDYTFHHFPVGHIVFAASYILAVASFLVMKRKGVFSNLDFSKLLNTILKVAIIAFLFFMSYVAYKAVQNSRYEKMDSRTIFDKWKKKPYDTRKQEYNEPSKW